MTDKNSPKKPEKNVSEIVAARKEKQEQQDKKAQTKTLVKPVKKNNWSLSFLLILIILLLGSAATLYFMPILSNRLPVIAQWIGKSPSSDIDTLTAKITALEQRVSKHSSHIQKLLDANTRLTELNNNLPKNPLPDNTDLIKRLEKLEQIRIQADKVEKDMSQSARIDMLLNRMSQLEASFVPLSKGLSDAQEARLERSQLSQTVATHTEQLKLMESRLENVEKYAARDNSGALLGFRIGELRRAATAGQDFSQEIDALITLTNHGSFATNEALQSSISWLQDHKEGLTTPLKLRDQFNQIIPTLIRAKSGRADDPWWMRAYSSAKNLVMVRKTSPTTEDTLEDNLDKVITDSQRLLEQFDLANVLALIKTLPENLQNLLTAWMNEAELYLQAEDQLNTIESLSAAYYLSPEKSEKKPEEKYEEKDAEL